MSKENKYLNSDFFLINKALNIHGIFDKKTRELKFIKNGECLDKRDMSDYTNSQLIEYIEGIINGLK
ncbi:MAG: hypothetical protein ACLFVR_14660 [Thiohalospira sp.]